MTRLNTDKWQEMNDDPERILSLKKNLIEKGRKDIFDLLEQESIESMLELYEALPITINNKHWELLQKYISKDLSNDDKEEISDFVSLAVTFHQISEEQPKSYAKLIDEIIEFKEIMFDLMPIGESKKSYDFFRYVLSVDIQETMKKTYQALSADALSHLNYAFWLMWHTDTSFSPLSPVRPITYPSQYYCAATVALERLTKQYKDETGFYRSIFKLWRDLGETDFKATCNEEAYSTPRISSLVGFTEELFKIIGILTNTHTKNIGTIKKDLARYKKVMVM